jgi:hypothetical protein
MASAPANALCEVVVEGPMPAASETRSTLGLVELFLKNHRHVDVLIRTPGAEFALVPRFLAIAVAGLTLYGVAISILLGAAALPLRWVPLARWSDGSAISLILAYDIGMIAACGVCLPSFYFYGLLAGIKPTMLQTALYSLKGQAATAVVLVGTLPIYIALSLGLVVFGAPRPWCEKALYFGLLLPFVAGLWGLWSNHVGFTCLADTLPEGKRMSRECFLRRLTTACGACYAAVTPVMIYTLWHHFAF